MAKSGTEIYCFETITGGVGGIVGLGLEWKSVKES